ncbi:hypothetical protein AGDE_16189 [Angomonas deanei]|uniref:Uncharacterized protein n=1 Tax=Angomonas deanei TaxID=59799 RepID=A0A7G2CTW0_9TRYP|nr:hypothetical protein AGDE_16189 [Angomonas deanei]CAD2221893.1 hypothetical protein, conserved [Angomonas deanei]|eukprot:EPY17561.1 hypothetical protein AGDE_16189 [Angomonas deanei]
MITGYKTAVFHTASKPDSEEAEFTLEELQRVTRKVMRRIRRKQNVTPQDVSALLGLEKAAESSSSGDDDDTEEPLLETRPPSGGLPPTPGGAPPAPPALDTLKRTKEIEKGFHYFETRVEERLDKAAPQKAKSTVKQATAVSTAAVLGLKRTVARQEPNFAELLQQTVAARQARQQAAVLAQLAPFTEGQSREDLLRWVRRCDDASGEQTALAESVVERAVRECFHCSEAEARALAEEELTARGDPAVTQGHAVLEEVGLRNETVLSRLTPSSRVVAQAQERIAEKEREASRRQADMETKEEEEYKKLVDALSKDPTMLQNRIADEVIEREFRVAPLQPVRRTVDLAAASLPPAAPTVWQQTEETRRHNEAQLRRLQSLAQQTDYMERERVGALLGTQPCHAPLQRDKTTTVARPALAKQTVAADMQKKMETHLNVHMEQKVAQAAVFEEPLELQKAKVMQSRPGLSIQLGAHLEQAEPELPGLDDFTIPTGMSSVTAEKEMELKDLFSALHHSLVEIPAAQQFESNYTQQRQQRMQGRATVARHATMNQK